MPLSLSTDDRHHQSYRDAGDNLTTVGVTVESNTLAPDAATDTAINAFKDQNHQDLLDVQTKLDAIIDNTDAIETNQDTQTSYLISIDNKVATEATLADFQSDNHTDLLALGTKLDTIAANTSDIDLNTDDLETLVTATNAALATIDGHVDGLEGLITTTNTQIGAINESAASTDTADSGLNGLVKRLNQHATTTEGKIDTVNSNLTTVIGHVDGLETLITSSNTKLDTVNTNLGTIQTNQDTLNAFYNSNFGANTGAIRTASQLGNSGGSADFNSGASTAQTLRTHANNSDGAGNLLTSTAVSATRSLDVNVTQSALPSGASTAANQSTINTSIGTTNTTLTETNLRIGEETETAAATDTSTSGLNGLFKRLLQRVTTLINFYAADYGASSGSIRTAAQVGNSTGTADFGYGNGTNQSLRVISVGYEGTRATYSAAASGLTPAASATDVFTITGSASKTIKITRISVTGSTTAGSGVLVNLQIIKRSTANSGGTSTTLTNVPHDSTSAAATATVRSYTANPTLGSTVGTIRAERVAFESTSVIASRLNWDFGTRGAKNIVLRGTSEVIAINLSAKTVTGGSLSIDIEWVEE